MRTRLLSLTAVLLLTPGLEAQTLGTITFPTSGAAAAQPAFQRGVLFLHSFEYQSAAEAFREAQRLDPGFAMAYWGEAMTYNHPIWNEQDTAAARAVLRRLGPGPEARQAAAGTDLERGWLAAVEVLYGDGPKPRRDTLYAGALERLYRAYPDDDEVMAFYALALLGLSQGVRDVPTYVRAGAIADEVFRHNPDHPGGAHYVIHAFDDPVHAPLGLRAARAYSRIAPAAPHAQHMTTHIFLALGLWDDVVSQNIIAAGPARAAWRPGHYTAWLGFGLLQQGRYREAGAHLDLVRQNLGAAPSQRAYLASMRAHYLVNTERWEDPAAAWTIDFTGVGPGAQAMDAFVLGYAAARRGDLATAERWLGTLIDRSTRPAQNDRYSTGRSLTAILERELRATLLHGAGRTDSALVLLREAAALEDAMPVEFGPPDVVKPTHELLGEVLLAAGRPAEAVQEFRRALDLAPRRALSLRGLARAAEAAGEAATARWAGAELAAVWHGADAAPGAGR